MSQSSLQKKKLTKVEVEHKAKPQKAQAKSEPLDEKKVLEFQNHMKKFKALSQLVEQTKSKAKSTIKTITQIEADLEGKALEAKNAHLEAEIAKRAKKN